MFDWVYDIESYPNIFSIGFKNATTKITFEISWRTNETEDLINFLMQLKATGDRLIGFNNLGYDYPVLHYIIENQSYINALDIYNKSNSIIKTPWDNRFVNVIWDDQQHVPQIDLYKIHHFDNPAKATSLKVLEFNMRSDFIEDLPFEPGKLLSWDECDQLISYMWNDIDETEKFYRESAEQIAFREALTRKYDRNFLNHNDTKIGKDYIIMKLEEALPGSCYDRSSGRREPRQTLRKCVHVKDILFPYIQFQRPEFQRMIKWFRTQTITDTKGAFKDVNCTLDGFQFNFGTGGIHGSVDPCIVKSDNENMILDVDVASYYPNLAIKNNLFPEHLGHQFCDIYQDVYEQRKNYPKGTIENAMLKLALNGVFGDSNNVYSVFYDPQYTMAITINGQLLLCVLAELLMQSDQIQMLQVNTDGLTVKCPRALRPWINEVCVWWEKLTNLELESVEYNRMFIRDCNNYIAEKIDGKLKRKGVYCHERPTENPATQEVPWHKNHSALVVPKAAEAALVNGTDIKEFVENHKDPYDFMLRTKVPRNSKLAWVDYHGTDNIIQNVSRYYISVMGGDLVKLMPPTATMIRNGKTATRRIGINTGWKVTECNDIRKYNPDDVEFAWYTKEAEKLVKPLVKGII